MKQDIVLAKMFAKLEAGRKPWCKENLSASKRGMLAMHKVTNGNILLGTEDVGFEMFCLGSSNVITLATEGRAILAIDEYERSIAQKVAVDMMWRVLDTGWVWEVATLVEPEELAMKIETLPTVPKGYWTAKALRMRRM